MLVLLTIAALWLWVLWGEPAPFGGEGEGQLLLFLQKIVLSSWFFPKEPSKQFHIAAFQLSGCRHMFDRPYKLPQARSRAVGG